MVAKHIMSDLTCYFNTELSNLTRRNDNKLSDMSEREKISTLMRLSQLKSLKNASSDNIENIINEAFTFNNGQKPSQELKDAVMIFGIAADTVTHGGLSQIAYWKIKDTGDEELANRVFNLTEINNDKHLQNESSKGLEDLTDIDNQLAAITNHPY